MQQQTWRGETAWDRFERVEGEAIFAGKVGSVSCCARSENVAEGSRTLTRSDYVRCRGEYAVISEKTEEVARLAG